MPYNVLLHPKVVAALRALPPAEAKRVRAALRKLEADPHMPRPGVDVKRLHGVRGNRDLARLRVGDLRLVFAIDGADVLVTDLFRRGAGYEV